MAAGSHKVVYAAIATNLAVAVSKFIVAAISGSAAMLAEGFHSAADSFNEILLLVGLKRSSMPADEAHPFGHGRELYFWSFIVAMSIFGIGGGLSILEGIHRFSHPEPLSSAKWNYIVLGLAFCFETYSWWIGIRELQHTKRKGDSLIRAIQHSKDPAVFTVVVEDTAALVGLVVAFLGVFLSHQFNNSGYDAAASIVVGIVLVLASAALAYETGGLLLGESVDKQTLDGLKAIIAGDPAVQVVGKVLTTQLGPEEVVLAAEVSFTPQLGTRELESTIDRIESAIQKQYPNVKHLYFEAERILGRTPAASSS